jgi:hypothetical protein
VSVVKHLEGVIANFGSYRNMQVRCPVGEPDRPEAVLFNFVDGVTH